MMFLKEKKWLSNLLHLRFSLKLCTWSAFILTEVSLGCNETLDFVMLKLIINISDCL